MASKDVGPGFCPECGSTAIRVEVCPGIHKVRDREVRIANDRHMVCANCGEWSYPGEMAGEMQREVTLELRRLDGLVSLEQLKAARMRYGFTQAEMEHLLGIGEKTWVRWERGKVPPSAAVDKEIRRFLDDPAYVSRLMEQSGVENATAREVIADAVNRAESRVAEEAAAQHPALPPAEIDSVAKVVLKGIARELARTFEPVRAAAESVDAIFARYVRSVPVDVDALSRDLGIGVFRDPNLGKDISGKIVREIGMGGRSGYAIYVNPREAFVRQRYTIAHELSHFLLHREGIGDGVTEGAKYRGPFSAPEEREANAKAAEILMPAEAVRKAYTATRSVPALARQFKTSEDAMRIRLQELRLAAG